MISYKTLSLIQSFFILLLGLSLFDFAIDAKIFNDKIFAEDPSDYWYEFSFWAYNIFIIGFIQIIKSFTRN